jgi:hypothetical protein
MNRMRHEPQVEGGAGPKPKRNIEDDDIRDCTPPSPSPMCVPPSMSSPFSPHPGTAPATKSADCGSNLYPSLEDELATLKAPRHTDAVTKITDRGVKHHSSLKVKSAVVKSSVRPVAVTKISDHGVKHHSSLEVKSAVVKSSVRPAADVARGSKDNMVNKSSEDIKASILKVASGSAPSQLPQPPHMHSVPYMYLPHPPYYGQYNSNPYGSLYPGQYGAVPPHEYHAHPQMPFLYQQQQHPLMYLQCIYGQKPSKHSRDNLKCEVQVNPFFGGSLREITSAGQEIQ